MGYYCTVVMKVPKPLLSFHFNPNHNVVLKRLAGCIGISQWGWEIATNWTHSIAGGEPRSSPGFDLAALGYCRNIAVCRGRRWQRTDSCWYTQFNLSQRNHSDCVRLRWINSNNSKYCIRLDPSKSYALDCQQSTYLSPNHNLSYIHQQITGRQ